MPDETKMTASGTGNAIECVLKGFSVPDEFHGISPSSPTGISSSSPTGISPSSPPCPQQPTYVPQLDCGVTDLNFPLDLFENQSAESCDLLLGTVVSGFQ